MEFREIILIKKNMPNEPIFRIPISETKCSVTVYSVFLNYESRSYRLDGKMFYAFNELVLQYQMVHKKFPQYAL